MPPADQIVPTVSGFQNSDFRTGSNVRLSGSGFVEDDMTVDFGTASVTDTEINGGINVYGTAARCANSGQCQQRRTLCNHGRWLQYVAHRWSRHLSLPAYRPPQILVHRTTVVNHRPMWAS